ncbi:hypothetical protein C7B61_07390 [filamentous cyanobacterium CCP1]|nr:hypothetical protein C7B76_20525 [filamentous cyanobacterium CCP2]PSB67210.1 hypothetical protein C7B61_07390 [filamentous cyanobacterium CCP1]
MSAAKLVPCQAVGMPSPSLSVGELKDQTTQQETPLHQITQDAAPQAPQRSQILEQADILLAQAQEEYQLGLYSDAEQSLILALSTVRSGDTGQFISPITRIRRDSISIFGLTLFRSETISTSGTGVMTTPEPIDNLYRRIINRMALGNESTLTLMSLPSQIVLAYLYATIHGVDLNQEIDPATLEGQLIARGVPPSDIENIVEEVRQRQINNYSDEYYRDVHTIELDTLRLLQKVLIKQNQPNKVVSALEFAEEVRNLESIRQIPAIAYALNNEVLSGRITDSRIPELIVPERASIENIQHFAEEEETTLVYFSVVDEAEIIAWVIQPNGAIHAKIIDFKSLGESLESISRGVLRDTASYVDRGEEDVVLVEALRTNTRTNELPIVREADQTTQLQQLYQLLISPIEEFLPAGSDSKVIFIPQRDLFLVPFAALRATSGEYLIDRFSIRVSPNLQYVLRDDTPLRRFPRGEEFLIVGNPTNPRVISLPGAEGEARFLSSLTGSPSLIGHQATQNNVFQGIEDAKVIHFASHGILDALPPSGDTILLIHNRENRAPFVQRILSTANSSSQGNQISYSLWPDEDETGRWHVIRTNGSLPGAMVLSDGDLTSQQLLNYRLDADLVVLSGCNTARGITSESALLGLPMTLGLSGVPQVVVSLWAVPDISTQQLMLEFYSAMREQGSNIDVANALREAMLEIKSQERYQDPIYWAGFTVIDVSQ